MLLGFVGRRNGNRVTQPLRARGIHVDAIAAFEGDSRTCTIICDAQSRSHPTVINEESPPLEPGSEAKLLAKVEHWIPRVQAVLTTGSLSMGLSDELYAEILDRARSQGKMTAIDAAGPALRVGLNARPTFMKPNLAEFFQLLRSSSVSVLAPHTVLTFGKAGASLIHNGTCVYASPPRLYDRNPIGAGDAFAAGYLKALLDGRSAVDSFRQAIAAASSDAATLRPGFVDSQQVKSMAAEVELQFSR